jgi:hypothetical protein
MALSLEGVMGNFGMFLTFVISFGLVIWNAKLIGLNRHLSSRIRDVELDKQIVVSEFREYQIAVKTAVRDFNGGMFKLLENS